MVCNLVKRFFYRPFVVKIIDILHIRTPMIWLYYLYYLLTVPKDKKKQISFNGIDVQFYIHTPLESRLVEAAFTNGIADEKVALKELLVNLAPGDIIYDIGANIGIYTVFMAKKIGPRGRVIAVEPEEHSYKTLQANINLNALNNVIPIQVALGNNFSEGILYFRGIAGEFSLINRPKSKFYQRVTIVIGDVLVSDRGLPLPNIVKIDVEGYEYYVIQGFQNSLKQDYCRMVFCEIHPKILPKEILPNNIINLLKSYGFNKFEALTRGETLHVFCYKTEY